MTTAIAPGLLDWNFEVVQKAENDYIVCVSGSMMQMARFVPCHESTGAEPSGMMGALRSLLEACYFEGHPCYVMFQAYLSSETKEFATRVFVPPRPAFNEGERSFVGFGSSIDASMNEAAYLAIIHLRHALPDLDPAYYYLPGRPVAGGSVYRDPNSVKDASLRVMVDFINRLDQHYVQLAQKFRETRGRMAFLETSLASGVARGTVPRSVLSDGAIQIPSAQRTPPASYVPTIGRSRGARISSIGSLPCLVNDKGINPGSTCVYHPASPCVYRRREYVSKVLGGNK